MTARVVFICKSHSHTTNRERCGRRGRREEGRCGEERREISGNPIFANTLGAIRGKYGGEGRESRLMEIDVARSAGRLAEKTQSASAGLAGEFSTRKVSSQFSGE